MQPLLLNCDWLGLSVLFGVNTEWHRPPVGHTLVDLDGTNVWKHRKILFNEYAEKMATILYEPKSKIIDRRAGLIEIANEWLYHGIGVPKILQMLNDMRLFTVCGMSRLDLAVDFNPTASQWDTIQQLAAGTAYVGGKRSGSGFWSVVKNERLAAQYYGQRVPHCISWGHKTTAVKWKLYFKSNELLQELGGKMWSKPYIVDCWREAGLDKSNVWRLEVSIKACNQLEYNGGRLTWQSWCEAYPPNLYAALYTQRFTVRQNDGHKDRSNDTIIDFLPIKHGGEIRISKPKNTNQRNGRITLLRHLVTSLEEHEVLLDDGSRESVLWHIQDIVERNGLENYFDVMAGCSVGNFVEETRCKAYELRDAGYNSLLDGDHLARERDTMRYVAQDKWREYENGELINIPIVQKLAENTEDLKQNEIYVNEKQINK